ncbi:AlbA family DNA-binding domain-containing protein [Lunatimonas salinarum]|uniref:AlbA family DNA-binding domain-containing protein n=1 Tax=Lunatimonas salinarum TaxID=1774590 RepID=UPI001ADF7E85|nr:ATP-binding protein [Lunatimonas salinarum]
MGLPEIIKLASEGEGLKLEFKKKAAHPEKIVRELIAFANTEGGYLLIGVDDDGTVSGQRFIEEEIYVMDKAIAELVHPPLQVQKEILHLNHKKGIAVYRIEKSPHRPHFLFENNRKKAYVRVADRSIQASKEMWEILKRQKRDENIIFHYGKKERILMQALEENSSITVREFMRIAKIPIFIASKTLIKLVLANVLQVIPMENEDLFVMKAAG